MAYVSATDSAKIIRKALKAELGASSKQISVRTSTYSMGSSIRVTIKVPGISRLDVERIANGEQRISRCEATGEILSGGNRFVFVSYSADVERPIREEVRRRIVASVDPTPGLEVRADGGDTYTIFHDGCHPAYGLDSCVHQVTRIMLDKGLTFGELAAVSA